MIVAYQKYSTLTFYCNDLEGDLAKYELGRKLGEGAFGQVLAARRKTDNVPVRTGNIFRDGIEKLIKYARPKKII